MIPAQLGVELRARRLKAGLTQAALAEAIGTTQPAVARVETGGIVPSLPFVDRWATATGYPFTITFGDGMKTLTPQQKGRLVRSVLGDDAFDPWERLEEKRARGMDVEPERRDLLATTQPRRKANIAVIVKVIGVDDLYLDRLGPTTATENVRDRHFASLLAVAVTNWDGLDWDYIENRIAETVKAKPALGKSMKTMHRRCRRIARNALARERAERL